MITGIF